MRHPNHNEILVGLTILNASQNRAA